MDFIERNARVGFGQPVLKGSRLTVCNIISYTSDKDMPIAEFLKDFKVSIDQLKSAVAYCKDTACKQIFLPTDQYCDGCILRTLHEGSEFVKDDYEEINGITYSKKGGEIFLGTLQELEESEMGVAVWLLARDVEKRLIEGNY